MPPPAWAASRSVVLLLLALLLLKRLLHLLMLPNHCHNISLPCRQRQGQRCVARIIRHMSRICLQQHLQAGQSSVLASHVKRCRCDGVGSPAG